MAADDRSDPEAAKGLHQLLEKLGILESSTCSRQLQSYLGLLQKWNRKVNLTSSTSWGSLKSFFLEALEAFKLYPPGEGYHLDIGSGAGFPALPLRILNPRMRLILIESRMKRAAFLEEVCRELGLASTMVVNRRIEDCAPLLDSYEPLDCISWKAIKLSESALSMLDRHCTNSTRFWMFHGGEKAVADPESVGEYLQLVERHTLVKARGWQLSVYASKRLSQRFT